MSRSATMRLRNRLRCPARTGFQPGIDQNELRIEGVVTNLYLRADVDGVNVRPVGPAKWLPTHRKPLIGFRMGSQEQAFWIKQIQGIVIL